MSAYFYKKDTNVDEFGPRSRQGGGAGGGAGSETGERTRKLG